MIFELRQYVLRPGRRDTLIELFDREFVESQEATGMTVVGQFRDLDRPDRFVWVRGFADMPRRADALAAFYGGPVWKEHGPAANATMIDSDDVLLLRPASAGSGFPPPGARRPPAGSVVVATIWYGDGPFEPSHMELFDRVARPVLESAGAEVIAVLRSEYAENTFPRLPVRTGEHVFVSFARFRDAAALAGLERSAEWRDVLPVLSGKPPERLRLAPTAGSQLR